MKHGATIKKEQNSHTHGKCVTSSAAMRSSAMVCICGLPEFPTISALYDHVITVTDRATKMVHLTPTFTVGSAENTAEQVL